MIGQFISVLMLASILPVAALLPGVTATSSPVTVSGQTNAKTTGTIDSTDLEAFLDNMLVAEMAENHVPGAMVAIVQDGSLLLAKGYGYADLENRTPVDPEHTLFRIGSVSKLLTWTAVMQLVEQGKVSLDADVNEYLNFAVPATFPAPITLRHLMSHTAGFEDKGTNMHKLQAEEMGTLGDYVKDNLPARIFSPGEVTSYSNYGPALAGYIVERVSGLSFNEYVEQNIFVPLGMDRSTFRQPIPATLAGDMATGYNYANGQYIASSFVFNQSYPVGAMSASATDMARFMIAHLQNGELDGRRILMNETAVQMHSRSFTPDPRLNGGMTYGFFENTINGQRVISHGGNLFTFLSGLYLIPDQNVGLFISTNSISGWAVTEAVIRAFLDRYFPVAEASDLQSPADFTDRIAPYLGEYTPVRSNFSSSEKVFGLMSRVNFNQGEGGLIVFSMPGQVVRLEELEPGVLQAIDDPSTKFVYYVGPQGNLFLAGVDSVHEPQTLFRTPWYGTRTLHLLLLLSSTLLFLGALIAWPIGFLIRRRKGQPSPLPTPLPARLARWSAAAFGLVLLLVLLGIATIFIDILPGFGLPRVVFETPPVLNIALTLSYVLAGLALAMLVFAVLSWVRRYWSLGGRIFYSLLTLLTLMLTWSLSYWNLFR